MDPRQRRTRTRLRTALLTLMRDTPYDDITVLQLIAVADVALPTFYRNYRNKLGLLEDMIDQLTEHFDAQGYETEQTLTNLLDPDNAHLLPLLRYVEAERKLFRHLFDSPHSAQVFRLLYESGTRRIAADPVGWSPMEVHIIAGCVIGNVHQWLVLDLPYTAEALAEVIHQTSVYGLLVAREENNDLRHLIRERAITGLA